MQGIQLSSWCHYTWPCQEASVQEESGVESQNISVSGSPPVSLYHQHCCLVYPSVVCWLSQELGSGANIYGTSLFFLDRGMLGIISLFLLLVLVNLLFVRSNLGCLSYRFLLTLKTHNLQPLCISLTFCDEAGFFMYIFLCTLSIAWGVPNTHEITWFTLLSFSDYYVIPRIATHKFKKIKPLANQITVITILHAVELLCLHWGYLGVDGWIILEWISRRWDVGMWTGLSWPRIETDGGPLWVR